MSEPRLTDLSILENMGMDDDLLIIELIELFLKNTPNSIRYLRKSCKDQDWDKLAAEAHKLKPNLSYMGLTQARDLVIEIETATKQKKNYNELISKIDQIDNICKKGYVELEERLEQLKS